MDDRNPLAPDDTALRVALWRALHLEVDAPPYVFEDPVALQLVKPESGWQERPDMSPFIKPFRASILARARFVEDAVMDAVERGVTQYLILGAGLDSFAQRHENLMAAIDVYEIDQEDTQLWKRARLRDAKLPVPERLHFVATNFESPSGWIDAAVQSGFDRTRPSVIASTGVSMYLSRKAIEQTLRQIAELASGTQFIMSFLVPIDCMRADVQAAMERAAEGAAAQGTPFRSFFRPEELIGIARIAGFARAEYVSAESLAQRYFAGRTDGLRPPADAEELLVATTSS